MSETQSFETLIVDQGSGDDAGIVTITLNRPHKKNAADAQMWADLLTVFRSLSEGLEARAVVITGTGGDFCSGADLSGGSTGEKPHQLIAMRRISDVALALHRLPMPVIAKVRGVAVGAGCNLALGCDLIVASDNARFSEIFARRGLAIDFGGSYLLPRLVGLHKAKELALLADVISAAEAERIGIVNRVVADDQLDAFVGDWARRLAAGPPLALRLTKRLLNEGAGSSMDQALEAEGWTQTVTIASSQDTTEAMQAFVEKRTPSFRGSLSITRPALRAAITRSAVGPVLTRAGGPSTKRGPGPDSPATSPGLRIRQKRIDRHPQPMQPSRRSRSRSSNAIC